MLLKITTENATKSWAEFDIWAGGENIFQLMRVAKCI